MFISSESQHETEISATSSAIQAAIVEPLSTNVKSPSIEHPITKVLRILWTDDVVAAHKAKTEAVQAMVPGNL